MPEPVRDQSGVRIYQGDAREILAAMPEESVQCVVTSPPYWGLRDYGTEGLVWGGEAGCEHEWGDEIQRTGGAQKQGETSQRKGRSSIAAQEKKPKAGAFCRLCGAWRGSLGMEPTIELYVEHIVEVFRDVRRVLRKDGTLWLNMGDCYATSPPGNKATGLEKWKTSGLHGAVTSEKYAATLDSSVGKKRNTVIAGLKPKDLVGQPWRVAFALQADGWYLRSDIIWAKPNPMPESIRDRPTKAHEYVFLFSKSKRYFFDQEAVRESQREASLRRYEKGYNKAFHRQRLAAPNDGREGKQYGAEAQPAHGRNIRSVWTIPTQPFPEAHFATFPEELARRCIAAGTSERGCCPQCGAPWVRILELNPEYQKAVPDGWNDAASGWDTGAGAHGNEKRRDVPQTKRMAKGVHPASLPLKNLTVGWKPGCKCTGGTANVQAPFLPIPCTVLDPFAGSGTTLLVAKKLGRRAVGIDLSLEYCEMASTRASGRGVMRRPRKRLRRRRVAR